jgi:peptidoglycan/LPS O-acetylase OafA/YrhL
VLAIGLFVLLANVQTVIGNDASFVMQGVIGWLLLLPAVFGSSDKGLSRRILRNRALAWVGLVSYAVYLYHATLIPPLLHRGLATAVPGVAWISLAVATLVLTLIVAGASYYLVERPAQRMQRKVGNRSFKQRVRPLPASAEPIPAVSLNQDA